MIPDQLKDLSGVTPMNDSEHYYCVEAKEFEMDRGILRGIIWGPRKDSRGNILTCGDGKVRIYPVINRRTSGANLRYVDHTRNVDFSGPGVYITQVTGFQNISLVVPLPIVAAIVV
jgi:hypothetical protein